MKAAANYFFKVGGRVHREKFAQGGFGNLYRTAKVMTACSDCLTTASCKIVFVHLVQRVKIQPASLSVLAGIY